MSDDVYFRLGERLNQHQVKMLLVEPYLKILQEFYTPSRRSWERPCLRVPSPLPSWPRC